MFKYFLQKCILSDYDVGEIETTITLKLIIYL